MINAQPMIEQLDQLISQYDSLCMRSRHDDLSDHPDESRVLAVQFQASIDRMTLPQSTYYKAADPLRSEPVHIRVVQLSGVVKALRADLQNDWVQQLSELVHADTLTGILEMAAELHDSGYKDAAAVITGTALELHLKELAIKHGIVTEQSGGRAKKADTVNAELKRANAYGLLQQKQITSWLGLRNSAAHGAYSAYDASEVGQLMSGVEHFVESYPA